MWAVPEWFSEGSGEYQAADFPAASVLCVLPQHSKCSTLLFTGHYSLAWRELFFIWNPGPVSSCYIKFLKEILGSFGAEFLLAVFILSTFETYIGLDSFLLSTPKWVLFFPVPQCYLQCNWIIKDLGDSILVFSWENCNFDWCWPTLKASSDITVP